MRLLPNDKDIGWLPYGYLLYLSLFLAYPLSTHARPWDWVLTGISVAAFLPLYFASFWSCGLKTLWPVAGMTALGVIYAAWNPGAAVFFIYAVAAAAFGVKPGLAWTVIGGIVAIIGIESFLLRLPGQFWVLAIVFSVFVGAMCIHDAQRKIANAKLKLAYDEIERLAKVAERERIARDLHDLLGHTLSLIVLKSELAGKLLEVDVARAQREILDLERVSRDALLEVRQAVRGYRSGNLAAEIARARAALESAGITVDCEADLMALPAPQENAMALALREAVTNVVRHANASTCRIRLRVADGQCAMEVRDNGCGGADQEGNGLRGMRERAEALGGSVRRRVGDGCSLAVCLPLGSGENSS
jgi:two-component system sensor histidine kinase DesK